MNLLSDRQSSILKYVIDEYVYQGGPIASKTIANKYKLNVSPATVRSELAILEKEGYLSHIFTSSGRIPTDKGYRYYVNYLLEVNQLTLEERTSVFKYFDSQKSDLQDILKDTTELIARMMFCIGIASNRSEQKNRIKHVDLVPVSLNDILVILISESGFVGQRHIGVKSIDNNIGDLEEFINSNFTKMGINEFQGRAENISRLLSSNKTFTQVCGAILDILNEQRGKEFYFKGTNYLMEYPEINDSVHMKHILSFLDESESAFQLLYEQLETAPYVVKIGRENNDKTLNDFSLIASNFKIKDKILGTVGMIAPRRINYNKAVASVCCVADNLSNYLKNNN